MKKLILFAAILFAGVSTINAETPKTSTLTVKLKPFQELIVSGNSVIEYNNKAHYTANASVEESVGERTVVTVSSAGSFAVSIEATDLVESSNPSNILSADYIHVTATADGTSITNDNAETTLTTLKSGTALISAANGGLDMVYNLAFRATGGEFFREVYNNGTDTEGTQNYVTTITYTIAAQ